jgi:negative regulator of flagellin synthesis FlgM
MPSFDIGPTRAVGAIRQPARSREARGQAPTRPRLPRLHARGASSAPVSAGQPPVDVERVAQIRKAVEERHLPDHPHAKVADAMIAAGFLLRICKVNAGHHDARRTAADHCRSGR